MSPVLGTEQVDGELWYVQGPIDEDVANSPVVVLSAPSDCTYPFDL